MRVSQMVSTVRKSRASIVAACWRRNCRQLVPSRSGAGGSRWWIRIARTELGEIAIPSPRSSPTIRR